MGTDPQELIRLVLDALPQAALVVRQDGKVLLRNAAAEAMLSAGEQVEPLLDRGHGSEVHWETEMTALAEGAGRVIRRNLALTGRGSRRLLVDVYLRDMGRRLPMGRSAPGGEGPADPCDGQPCVLMLVEDISGRRSMQRRVAAGERLAAAGALAARVAHELNNPLDGVLRFVGLAERLANAEAGKYLASAREGLMRMVGIIRGLLEQGRPWQAAGERAPVRRLLDEAITAMHPRAQSLGVAIVCDLDDAVEGLAEGTVFQVFCNVIKNALDAMPNGGMLQIRLVPAADGCDIEFSDTGCGLTDAEAERIFEPFYTTKPPAEGCGLGLAICREIVGRLGGTISARGRSSGGVTVAVRLPLEPLWKATAQEKRS
jgi:signal transduction histidine kinase